VARHALKLNPEVASLLTAWYRGNARPLPWRRDRDPYRVWLAEIMLQQTRIETVLPYYGRFLEELPRVGDLAASDEDRLMKLWEGLGYYSRARNLRRAAIRIMEEHGGRFPETPEEIRALPGVGPYTAGAIASICFDLPVPAVDGNALRVCARLAAFRGHVDTPESIRRVTEALRTLYDGIESPGALTQAIMELGETVCLPGAAPLCPLCPVAASCRTRRAGACGEIPARAPKPEKREADVTVLLLRSCGKYALRRRPATGLLAGLWEFPNTEKKLGREKALACARDAGAAPVSIAAGPTRMHTFTHIRWRMRSWIIECGAMPGGFVWADAAMLASGYALPTAFRKLLPPG
jgi:A/G-specific adenine glycosylase